MYAHARCDKMDEWLLRSWQTAMTQMGCKMRVSVNWGCLHNGILPHTVEPGGGQIPCTAQGLYTQGYADDFALSITGKSPSTVSELMQRALNIVQSWCRTEELPVSPDKTELVLFTKRKDVERFVEPVLLNRTLHPTSR
jgi:hypothetical protein